MAKYSAAIIILLYLGLGACASGNVSSVPTTVPLNNLTPGEGQLQVDGSLPTSTQIPPPSPTATLTPVAIPLPELEATPVRLYQVLPLKPR